MAFNRKNKHLSGSKVKYNLFKDIKEQSRKECISRKDILYHLLPLYTNLAYFYWFPAFEFIPNFSSDLVLFIYAKNHTFEAEF